MRVKFLRIKQFTAITTYDGLFIIISYYSSSVFCRANAGGNRVRSVRPGGKYRSIRHTKISVIQTGIFGRAERARSQMMTTCKSVIAGL